MKSKVSIIFFWILVAVVFVYLAASIIPSVFSSEEITVAPALSIVYDDVLNVSGIALRDEVLVSAKGTPTSIDYKVSDGDRVSIGDTLATYSTVQAPVKDRLAVEVIDRQIALLKECVSSTTQYDLKTLDAKTKDAIRSYLSTTQSRDLSKVLDASVQVSACFIKRDMKVSGDKSYYQKILENCEATRSTLLTGNNAQQSGIYASQAGYFSSQFDGYESLKSSDYRNCDPTTVQKLLSQTPNERPSDYVGKLQHFSYWNYLCNIPVNEASRFEKNSTWTFRFDTVTHGIQSVTMTVKNVSDSIDGQVAITFECPSFNEALFSLRISNAQIVLKSYSGYKIDKDAIRVYEGETGVYVLSGAKLVFKPLTVLYRDETRDFAVVTPNTNSISRTLILNDSVVIGGKEVYDGKVVNIN